MGSSHRRTRQEQDNGKLWAPLGIFLWGSPLTQASVEIHLDFIHIKRKDCHMEEGGENTEGVRPLIW